MPQSTIHLKGKTYEVYSTGNPVIRALNRRFLRAVEEARREAGFSEHELERLKQLCTRS